MALFDRALVAFSIPNVWFLDSAPGQHTRRAHLLLTEYAKNQYVLVLCELADGVPVCNDPPKVIKWVPIPNKRVDFNFEGSSKKIDVSIQTEWSFSLIIQNTVDYWEVVRTIAETNAVDTLHKMAIDKLVQGAIDTIPTVRLRVPPLADGGDPANAGEDALPAGARDGDVQTVVGGSAAPATTE